MVKLVATVLRVLSQLVIEQFTVLTFTGNTEPDCCERVATGRVASSGSLTTGRKYLIIVPEELVAYTVRYAGAAIARSLATWVAMTEAASEYRFVT